jgi:hypothetical protein
MHKFMRLLMASTALAMIAGAASASNFIDINVGGATTGTVQTLAITQDNVSATNAVAASGTAAAPVGTFAVNGPWRAITIGQTSGAAAGNILSGSISSGSGTANDFTANYTTNATAAGNNVHSLALTAGTTALANIAVTNTGATDNTITDALTASEAVTYSLTLDGTGNKVINTIGQGTGNAATSIGLTVAATGSNNTITNTSVGSGAKTIDVSLASSGNTVVNSFGTVAGDQTSNLTADVGSKVNYELDSSAASTSATVNLNGVVGASTAAGGVNVTQSGIGDTANLTVNGYQNGVSGLVYAMGTLATDTVGVRVTQVSANAILNAVVTAAAAGYTANIHQ